jgi:endonuclease V-like protein UPF0215 family
LPYKRFRVIKPEIRVLGIDDGVFVPRKGFAPIVGVVFRGGYWLDGVVHTKVRVDGLDATSNIASMILESPHCEQLRVIMLNGITCAGFNVIDINELSNETRLPVIAVTRGRPNFEKIHEALKNLPNSEERWKTFLNAGEPFEVCTRSGSAGIYAQVSGIHKEDAERILKLTSTRSNIPEALRVAHIIASGTSIGIH